MSTAGGFTGGGQDSRGLLWSNVACFLAGIIAVVAVIYVTDKPDVLKVDEHQIREIVKEHLGKEYPSTERLLEMIRAEVEGEHRKRVDWERRCIEWVESLAHQRRIGAPGVPGAVGAAPEVPPPAVDE